MHISQHTHIQPLKYHWESGELSIGALRWDYGANATPLSEGSPLAHWIGPARIVAPVSPSGSRDQRVEHVHPSVYSPLTLHHVGAQHSRGDEHTTIKKSLRSTYQMHAQATRHLRHQSSPTPPHSPPYQNPPASISRSNAGDKDMIAFWKVKETCDYCITQTVLIPASGLSSVSWVSIPREIGREHGVYGTLSQTSLHTSLPNQDCRIIPTFLACAREFLRAGSSLCDLLKLYSMFVILRKTRSGQRARHFGWHLLLIYPPWDQLISINSRLLLCRKKWHDATL